MTRYHNINGSKVAFTAEEEKARDAEEAKVASDKTANQYKLDRTVGEFKYPSVVEQLDLIYHSGIDAWKAEIKKTKDKYPKP